MQNIRELTNVTDILYIDTSSVYFPCYKFQMWGKGLNNELLNRAWGLWNKIGQVYHHCLSLPFYLPKVTCLSVCLQEGMTVKTSTQ